MRTRDFDYDLPAASIAQEAAPRGESRLLALDREGPERHARVGDLPRLLRPGNLLVLNDTRVIPARLFGQSAGGGRMEILLVERRSEREWDALVKPGRRARPGAVHRAFRRARRRSHRQAAGTAAISCASRSRSSPTSTAWGTSPPPYIHRPDTPEDRERYQTVFAREPGAVAAPTAGLHFTQGSSRRSRRPASRSPG